MSLWGNNDSFYHFFFLQKGLHKGNHFGGLTTSMPF